MMVRKIFLILFILGIVFTFFFSPRLDSGTVAGLPNFTYITRTSTPEPTSPPPPTSTPGSGGSNPTNTPAPTATPQFTATPTFIPVTLVATPEGGFLPTAVPCGFPPTLQAQDTTRIRTGPGTDYEVIGRLAYLETRPIVGRAVDAEWWVIQLAGEQTGWVANAVVTVQGNTSGVPAVAAPEINGATPTPGPLWQPTPNPDCPVTPTVTPPPPTATAETAAPTEPAAPTETAAPPPAATEPNPTETATTAPNATETATATSVVPQGAATHEAEAEAAPTATPQPTAVPLEETDPPTGLLLPCAASGMIGLAFFGFLALRRFI